jgi:hypothetical protein
MSDNIFLSLKQVQAQGYNFDTCLHCIILVLKLVLIHCNTMILVNIVLAIVLASPVKTRL